MKTAPFKSKRWIGFRDAPVLLGGDDVDGGIIELLYAGTEGQEVMLPAYPA